MTPQILYQRALAKHSASWSGQQAMIRRIGRVAYIPLETIQETLMLAEQKFLDTPPRNNALPAMMRALNRFDAGIKRSDKSFVRIRPNRETPLNLVERYLSTPLTFGLNDNQNVLNWARYMSTDDLLKMQTGRPCFQSIALFERGDAQCLQYFKMLTASGNFMGTGFAYQHLMGLSWTSAQRQIVQGMLEDEDSFMSNNAPVAFLDHAAQNIPAQLPIVKHLNRFDYGCILDTPMSIDLYMHALPLALEHGQKFVEKAVAQWHARSPSKENVMSFALILDAYTYDKTHAPTLLSTLAGALGKTPEQQRQSIALYQQFGPELMSFAMIARSLYTQETYEPVLDVFELDFICP